MLQTALDKGQKNAEDTNKLKRLLMHCLGTIGFDLAKDELDSQILQYIISQNRAEKSTDQKLHDLIDVKESKENQQTDELIIKLLRTYCEKVPHLINV